MISSKPVPAKLAALLPSLTDLMFLLPALFVFAREQGAQSLLEGDTGWHLRAGDWILAHGRVPASDMFSYTMPGQPWFAWEWLWDLGFALLHRSFGMASVIWVSLLVLCLTSALLFRLVLRLCPYRLPAAAITFLAVMVTSLHWLARPHIFSWLFIVLTLWVLEWKRTGERNLLWCLPLLTVLWVNVHGGFFVVLLLLGAYAAGEIAAGFLEPDAEKRGVQLRRALPYGATMAVCLAASLVNPYGYHLHEHILRYVGNPQSPAILHINEWQSISFQLPVARYVEAMIFLSLAAAFWHAIHRRFAFVFLIAGWLHLGLASARNLPIFAIVAAPITALAAVEIARRLRDAGVAAWVARALGAVRDADLEFSELDRLPRLHWAGLAGLAVLGVLLSSPAAAGRFYPSYSEKQYPVKALGALSALDLSGKVFADDEWGDYLIYRLYPSTKVFIDGRFDFYGARHTQDYLDILAGKHDWEKRLAKFQIESILLPAGGYMATIVKESGRWVPVYDDGVAIYFHSRQKLARIGVHTSPGSSPLDHGNPAQTPANRTAAHNSQHSRKGA